MQASSPSTASRGSTCRSTPLIPTSFAKSPAGARAAKGVNEYDPGDLVQGAHDGGMDLTIIEVMPLGDVGEGRLDQYLPLSMVRAQIAKRFTLTESDYRTGGPAPHAAVEE